jgi:hypothetical protein
MLQRFSADSTTEEKKQLHATASPENLARWEALAAHTLTLDAAVPADWGIVRFCLLDFIADFANWDNLTVPAYLETSRALTKQPTKPSAAKNPYHPVKVKLLADPECQDALFFDSRSNPQGARLISS